MPRQDNMMIGLVAQKLAPFHRGDERLGVLLALSVGRLMMKAARAEQEWEAMFRDGDIRHVADWLKASIANEAGWLGNVDAQGRPKKLMKFGTMDAIVKEADKAMLIEAQKLGGVLLSDGDEELVAELSDGMYLVRLTTPAALDRESAVMQHCIGNGGYDELLSEGNFEFLSLRDRHGNAHATLEIEDGCITQLQGKQNRIPARKYVDILVPFMKDFDFQADVPAYDLGYVVDVNGRWHALDTLPDGLVVPGSLNLTGVEITRLPKRLKVQGDLCISKTRITELPEGLAVRHCVYAINTDLEKICGGVSVGKTLFIGGTPLRELPDDLFVGLDISMKNSLITELPPGLGDNKRIVTSEGPMSAAKFRARYSVARDSGLPSAVGV
jgi:hypothetical protein